MTKPTKAKPVSAATRALLDEMTADSTKPVTGDRLDKAKAKLRELRDLQFEKENLEKRSKEVSASIQTIKFQSLVDLMDEAGINILGLEAEGNLPALTVQLDEYVHANIPKDNEEQAYNWLKKTKNEDMIKTVVTIEFGRGEAKETAACLKLLDKAEIAYSLKQGVPWNTLTAFVKTELKKEKSIINEKVKAMLGATVSRVADVVKQKKENK